MGTWGPGLFENDHAADLWSVEAAALAAKLGRVLDAPTVAFDDLEGPLVYVRLLARMAADHPITVVDRATVAGWRRIFVDAFRATITGARAGYVEARVKVIEAELDALAARLAPDAVAPAARARPARAGKKAPPAPRATRPATRARPARAATSPRRRG